MRISTQTMSNIATGSTSNAYEKYAKILEKITSNKNFTKMSENVPEAKKLIKAKDELAQLDEYQSNIKTATSEMGLAYDVLGDLTDEIGQINNIVLDAANATTTTSSAKAMATEVKERVATIVDLMNTKYMKNYIFSGSNVQTPAYTLDDETGDVTYNGSSKENGERLLTIAQDTTFQYNLTGDNIFGKVTLYDKTTDANGNEITVARDTDFFTEMQDLNKLLNADTIDQDAIRDKLNVLDAVSTNIINQTGDISAKVSKLNSASSINDTTITNLTEKKVDIEEVDIIKAATELANAQSSLQASYTLTSTILRGNTLLDYL